MLRLHRLTDEHTSTHEGMCWDGGTVNQVICHIFALSCRAVCVVCINNTVRRWVL